MRLCARVVQATAVHGVLKLSINTDTATDITLTVASDKTISSGVLAGQLNGATENTDFTVFKGDTVAVVATDGSISTLTDFAVCVRLDKFFPVLFESPAVWTLTADFTPDQLTKMTDTDVLKVRFNSYLDLRRNLSCCDFVC